MSLFTKVFGIDKLHAEIKALQSVSSLRQFDNLSRQVYPSWNAIKELEAYRIYDDVYSVVKRLSETAAKIPVYSYDEDDVYLPKENKVAAWLRGMSYKKRLQMFTYLFLCDECFLFKEKIEVREGSGIVDSYFLHPNLMTVVLSEEFPTKIIGYVLKDNAVGFEMRFTADEIVFSHGFNPSTDRNLRWRGFSKITALLKTLTRLKAGQDASVAQIQNGGIPGIVYEKSADFTVEYLGLRKKDFAGYQANPENKGAPYFAPGEMGWIPLGLSLVDLDVADLATIDFKKICNAYSVSDRIFNNDATGSEISDNSANVGLYVNGIEPTLTLIEEDWTTEVMNEFNQPGYIKFDLSDIQVLQEDMVKKMTAMATAPIFKPNEVLEAAGLEKSDDPLMEKYFIKTGYNPIDSFDEIPPVE